MIAYCTAVVQSPPHNRLQREEGKPFVVNRRPLITWSLCIFFNLLALVCGSHHQPSEQWTFLFFFFFFSILKKKKNIGWTNARSAGCSGRNPSKRSSGYKILLLLLLLAIMRKKREVSSGWAKKKKKRVLFFFFSTWAGRWLICVLHDWKVWVTKDNLYGKKKKKQPEGNIRINMMTSNQETVTIFYEKKNLTSEYLFENARVCIFLPWFPISLVPFFIFQIFLCFKLNKRRKKKSCFS